MNAQNDNAPKLANQIKKALRLVSIVDAVMLADGLDPLRHAGALRETLERAPDGQWRTMAVGQGERPPSAETKELVLDVYRARARAVALAEMLEPVGTPNQHPHQPLLSLYLGGA